MKRTTMLIALTFAALATSNAAAQTHDHFARQRQEAAARQAAAQHHLNHGHSRFDAPTYRPGHWGGPTTHSRFYQPTHRQNVQFYPVPSYGYGFPGCGYGYGGYPYYGSPYGRTGTYIHREIYLGR